MGVFEEARLWLEPRVRPDDQKDQANSVWQALRVAHGRHPNYGVMAYWEHRALGRQMNKAVDLLGGPRQVDDWLEVTESRWDEVSGALTQAHEQTRLRVDGGATLRPWCDRGLISKTKVPYVQIAAVVHLGLEQMPDRPLQELLDGLDIDRATDPWRLLDTVDEKLGGSKVAPSGVNELADRVRALEWNLAGGLAPLAVPGHLLLAAAQHPVSLERLASVLPEDKGRSAGSPVGAEERG